jgi:pyruvate,orthophosphate dikinase
MQVRAIFEGALAAAKVTGAAPQLEIMVPLVASRRELEIVRARVDHVAETVFSQAGEKLEYSVGSMIELPRAVIVADEIAAVADFFSFGTNDLTQTAWGISRDDAGKFLSHYVEAGILPRDPFASIDVSGVGKMVRLGVEQGRSVKPTLKVGVCGEHGGDPASIAFFELAGLDYVSCSPYRIPIARLAAAQAALAAAGDDSSPAR